MYWRRSPLAMYGRMTIGLPSPSNDTPMTPRTWAWWKSFIRIASRKNSSAISVSSGLSAQHPIDSLHRRVEKWYKVLPYSLPSVGHGADPGVQAVSLQVTLSHPFGGRLPLLSAKPAVTFPAKQRHRSSASTKLYCLVTEAHGCEQLAQGC